MYCQSNDWCRFRKILWPSQNIWTLQALFTGRANVPHRNHFFLVFMFLCLVLVILKSMHISVYLSTLKYDKGKKWDTDHGPPYFDRSISQPWGRPTTFLLAPLVFKIFLRPNTKVHIWPGLLYNKIENNPWPRASPITIVLWAVFEVRFPFFLFLGNFWGQCLQDFSSLNKK